MTDGHGAPHISDQSRALDLVAALAAWLPGAELLPGWAKDPRTDCLLLEVQDEH